MIGRRGRLLALLYMVFLAVLFLMCSTDLIIREPEKEVYQIAVIIEDVRSDNYSNFRKGMDQAAVEFNADVHFITLYEKLDADQQMELMDREQQDGADALVVVPADEERVEEKQVAVPVVFLCPGLTGEAGAGRIVIDYKRMGEQLAREMLEDMPGDNPVLMLTDPEKHSAMDRLFLEGASAVLADGGHSGQSEPESGEEGARTFQEEKEAREGSQALLEELKAREGVRALMEGLKAWEGEKVLLLAESPDILAEAAGILAEREDIRDRVEGLYGRGSTLQILNYLDRGLITGVCVTDEFGMGYFSVDAAVRMLEKADFQPSMEMDSYYIEKKSLREPAFEKLLFPIE